MCLCVKELISHSDPSVYLNLNLIASFLLIYCPLFQTLTPHMQSPVEDLYTPRSLGKLSGPSLGNQQQGGFSINLWKSAFHDAFNRICPVRAGGHECGCLPVLARKVCTDSICCTSLIRSICSSFWKLHLCLH